jgi:hypothetical protein
VRALHLTAQESGRLRDETSCYGNQTRRIGQAAFDTQPTPIVTMNTTGRQYERIEHSTAASGSEVPSLQRARPPRYTAFLYLSA